MRAERLVAISIMGEELRQQSGKWASPLLIGKRRLWTEACQAVANVQLHADLGTLIRVESHFLFSERDT